MSIASAFGAARAYYGPHNTVSCPDCGGRADADFGDHGGQCLAAAAVALPGTALGIIHRHALTHRKFCADDLADDFQAKDIPSHSRGPAFGEAKRRGWIETDGYKPSARQSVKRHPIAQYISCIYQPATAVESARDSGFRPGRRTA